VADSIGMWFPTICILAASTGMLADPTWLYAYTMLARATTTVNWATRARLTKGPTLRA
jgi:hypothetical protein